MKYKFFYFSKDVVTEEGSNVEETIFTLKRAIESSESVVELLEDFDHWPVKKIAPIEVTE